MSKLSKFIRNPRLFWKDAITNIKGRKPSNINRKASSDDLFCFAFPLLSPKVIIHSGDSIKGGGENHLRMWVPSFIETGIPFLILVRNEALFRYVRRTWPNVPVAFARTSADIDTLMGTLHCVKSVFYTSNAGNNVHMIRLSYLRHIFIGHGDSDKAGSANKFFRAYDEVWAAGQAQVDRLKQSGFNIGHLKIRKIGRPNLLRIVENLPGQNGAQPNDATHSLRFMYLPTWEGNFGSINYSSLYISVALLEIVAKLPTAPSIFIKLHPVTGCRDRSLSTASKQIHKGLENLINPIVEIPKDDTLSEHLLRANAFICDISSVITECLSVDAPLFVYKPATDRLPLAESAMPIEQYAYVFSNSDDFKIVLNEFLNKGDILRSKRIEARRYFLGIDETLNNEFANRLKIAAI
jgi:hypothetical protein